MGTDGDVTAEKLPIDSPASTTTGNFSAESASVRPSHDEQHAPFEGAIESLSLPQTLPLSKQATSVHTTGTTDPRYEIDWDDEDDPKNPRNWPLWYRGVVIVLMSFSTWVV